MKSLVGSILLALALTIGVAVQAQTFEYSSAAYKRNDYRTAFTGFKKLAEKGDASAQSMIGVMYRDGEGIPKDAQKAVFWFRKAAEQGEVLSQFELGHMYANGQGVPEDDHQAAAWYRKAAEQGYPGAQINLGLDVYGRPRGSLGRSASRGVVSQGC
jgi:hypothetical protein